VAILDDINFEVASVESVTAGQIKPAGSSTAVARSLKPQAVGANITSNSSMSLEQIVPNSLVLSDPICLTALSLPLFISLKPQTTIKS